MSGDKSDVGDKAGTGADGSSEHPPVPISKAVAQTPDDGIRNLLKALALNGDNDNGHDTDVKPDHKFWSTQPVVQPSDLQSGSDQDGPIEADRKHDQIQATPYNLPKDFEWSLLDIGQDGQMQELYALLRDHYVEDSDAMFRFDYSKEFLRWSVRASVLCFRFVVFLSWI